MNTARDFTSIMLQTPKFFTGKLISGPMIQLEWLENTVGANLVFAHLNSLVNSLKF
jgi:hypothetical protein